MDDIPSTLDTASFRHLVLDGVSNIEATLANISGFSIPEYDEISIAYYGTTNNISSVVYKKDLAVVATLTLLYSVQPPTTNDANLVKVTVS